MSSLAKTTASNLIYRVAVKEDSAKLLDFLFKYFAKDEPCNRALQMPHHVMEVLFTGTVERCLQKPFSTIVINPEKNDEVAACLLASVWNRSDPAGEADFAMGAFPENAQLFVKFLNSMHEDFWKLAPKDVEAVIHREIVSVGTPYMRQGISSKMLTHNLSKKLLKQYNIGGLISEASSLANQKVEEKHGFKTLLAKPYDKVVDSNGNQVLKLDDGTTDMKLNFIAIGDLKNLPE
ncbi:unnamed protein product [Caenorhabditis brenneri]